MEELLYQIGITLIPGIGDRTAKNLIAHCGSPKEVFSEKKRVLERIPGIGPKASESISKQKVLSRAEREWEFLKKNNIKALYFTDPDYPFRLKQCEDGPVMLYCKGEADLNPSRSLSVVGSRNATSYGLDLCKKLIAELLPYNPLIISGLAYGVDITAHRAALDNGLTTIGVLAHGLDRVYPPAHSGVAQKMIDGGGALATDFLSDSNPDRENFPKRNRIIAGMCDAVIVVEAALKGGALITAEIANSYNRDVFAIPGRLGDGLSAGCNHLIKTHRAALITGVDDLRYILNWDSIKTAVPELQTQLMIDLSQEEEKIYNSIKSEGKIEIDNLCIKTGLQVNKVLHILMNLELKGAVKSLPGKLYTLA